MSHNSKNARKIREAKAWGARRKTGGSGPSATVPKHGKKNRKPYGLARNAKPAKKDEE